MKKFIIVSLFLLAACTTPAKVSAIQSTLTPLPTSIPPTVVPTSTVANILPTITPTVEVSPTPSSGTQQVSSTDGMPQVYVPAGIFHMGGMDVRRALNEIPDHDVELDAFWMDQLEVTNAMYGLCVEAGGCTLPQSLKSQRRPAYFNNP